MIPADHLQKVPTLPAPHVTTASRQLRPPASLSAHHTPRTAISRPSTGERPPLVFRWFSDCAKLLPGGA